MKLLRVGSRGNEKVAALDLNNKFRDLSFYTDDLNPDTISFELLVRVVRTIKKALELISPGI
jgi:hypothetical protein